MSRRKQRGEDFKQEDVLQAVVIADSFNVKFAPITESRPRALLPLVNTPLLDYTLEFLCAAGIQEVILFCCSHASLIKEHLNNSKWLLPTSPMDIITIVSEDCMSMGDALRDIDAKSLISNDFVLVNGDVVSNMKLKPLIEEHKQRRLKEKTPIMTMVMKRAESGHQSRSRRDDVVLTVTNSRILSFDRMAVSSKFTIPLELFKEHKSIALRQDLLDCQIAVCSPQVLPLFTDNFDYLTREDFIRGILENEEILGNTIHLHVIEDEYAARVTNYPMYDAVSQDVLSRWAWPMVPDANISNRPADACSYGRHHTYQQRDVTLARGCILQENVAIGRGTSVGSNSVIVQSVIGKNCVIGENVHLEGAYLWDAVRVEDGCRVQHSVLDEGVTLRAGVTTSPGCVLAKGVVVGPSICLPQGTLLTSTAPDAFSDDEEDVTDGPLPSLLGSEGCGFVYERGGGDADSDEDEEEELDLMGLTLESDEEQELFSGSEDETDDDGSFGNSPPPDEFKLFYDEVVGTLERSMAENIGLDNTILEINSLKHAYGIQIREVNQLVTRAVLELPLKAHSDNYLQALVGNLKKLAPVLKNYIRSGESQKDCLSSMEEVCLSSGEVAAVLVKLLHYLYNLDVLAEEAILAWHQRPPEEDEQTEQRRQLRTQVVSFITWLEEAEEEDSDSDEESD